MCWQEPPPKCCGEMLCTNSVFSQAKQCSHCLLAMRKIILKLRLKLHHDKRWNFEFSPRNPIVIFPQLALCVNVRFHVL